jgi:ribosomal protein S18 acetylase RimI-like enzyme
MDPVANGIAVRRLCMDRMKYDIWREGGSILAVKGRHALFGGDWEGVGVPFELLPRTPFWSSAAPASVFEQVRRRYVMSWKSPCWTLVAPRPARPDGGWERLEPLRPKDAETVARFWRLHDNPLPHIRECVRMWPSACIRVDGELAAWGGNHFVTDRAAELGFAHTRRRYRRRGFGRRITVELTHKLYEMGLTPYCYVFKTNEASYRMCKQAGFEERGDVAWFGVKRLRKRK